MLELRLVEDELVGRCDQQAGLWVALGHHHGAPCHRCQSAAADGFLEYVLVINLRQLLIYQRQVIDIGRYIDMVERHEL